MVSKHTLADIPVVVVNQHIQAPTKPAWGEPCNGCGACCLLEPCPLGVIISGHRSGACMALVWVDQECRYQCGMLVYPTDVLAQRWPRMPKFVNRWLGRRLSYGAARWISAGSGCDAAITVDKP